MFEETWLRHPVIILLQHLFAFGASSVFMHVILVFDGEIMAIMLFIPLQDLKIPGF